MVTLAFDKLRNPEDRAVWTEGDIAVLSPVWAERVYSNWPTAKADSEGHINLQTTPKELDDYLKTQSWAVCKSEG
jgi:hypothetical protein